MGYTVYPDNIVYAASGGTGTLQDAINQAQSTGKPLYISPGTYSTGDLIISGPVEIYATPGSVVLQPSSATNGFTLNVRSNTAGATIADVTIRGITFYGALKPFATAVNPADRWILDHYTIPGNFNAIISAYKVTRLTILNCAVNYSGSNGLAMWQCTATVENNDFGGNRLCAIYSCDGWATSIVDNFVHEGENAGIVVCRPSQAFDGTVIRGNHIYDTRAIYGANTGAGQVSGSGWFGNAIYLAHASNAVIDQNVTAYSAFSGIRVIAAWNCTMTNNQIFSSQEVALFLEAPGGTPSPTNPERYEGGLIANNVINGGGLGINVANGWWGGRRAVVSGNTITDIVRRTFSTTDPNYPTYTTTGAGIFAESDVVVSDNIVDGATQGPGIVISPGQISGSTMKITASATGNTVKQSLMGIGFFKEYANGYSLVASNIVEGATGGAIVPVTLPGPAYDTVTRVPGSTDYGTTGGGTYTGKPFANVMIGLNFAV